MENLLRNKATYCLKYIELKSGYSDDGPAWIGKVMTSRTENTVYFNNKAFRKSHGVSGNYYDLETGEEYWISNVKKDGTDRHWAGHGKIIIDTKIIAEYLVLIGKTCISEKQFIVANIVDQYPVDRINKLENQKKNTHE